MERIKMDSSPTKIERKHAREEVSDDEEDIRNKRSRPDEELTEKHQLGSVVGAVAQASGAAVLEAVVPQKLSTTENQSDEASNIDSSAQDKKLLIQKTNLKPEILNRNKRMFGSLMGHLGLAKEKLEKESDRINKQLEMFQTISKKSSDNFTKMEIAQKKDSKKQFFEKKISAIRTLSANYKNYLESLQYSLCTNTEPKILWLPANHNKLSRELLVKRQEEVSETTVPELFL
jgi:hypothetical protein